jgi:hypothetical protein
LHLSDKDLLASYNIALELKLEQAFIAILEKELNRRGIVYSLPSKNDSKPAT